MRKTPVAREVSSLEFPNQPPPTDETLKTPQGFGSALQTLVRKHMDTNEHKIDLKIAKLNSKKSAPSRCNIPAFSFPYRDILNDLVCVSHSVSDCL